MEDQQREINCEVFVACDGQKRRINGGHVFKFDGGPCDLCHPSAEVAQLRADGQRLRTALEKIAAWPLGDEFIGPEHDATSTPEDRVIHAFLRRARAALGGDAP